jgi:hypothetical protein
MIMQPITVVHALIQSMDSDNGSTFTPTHNQWIQLTDAVCKMAYHQPPVIFTQDLIDDLASPEMLGPRDIYGTRTQKNLAMLPHYGYLSAILYEIFDCE